MSTNNICFGSEIRKIFFCYALLISVLSGVFGSLVQTSPEQCSAKAAFLPNLTHKISKCLTLLCFRSPKKLAPESQCFHHLSLGLMGTSTVPQSFEYTVPSHKFPNVPLCYVSEVPRNLHLFLNVFITCPCT